MNGYCSCITCPAEQYELIKFFKYHRHYGVSVDVFSQSFEDMDVTLRRLAQNFYVVRRSVLDLSFPDLGHATVAEGPRFALHGDDRHRQGPIEKVSVQSVLDVLQLANRPAHFRRLLHVLVLHQHFFQIVLYDHRDCDTWLTIRKYSAHIAQEHADWEATSKGTPIKLDTRHDYAAHVEEQIKQAQCNRIADSINDMPRKILNYDTARERFEQELAKLQAAAESGG